jgi:GNAT superfamily N-acetyltransferase
MRESRLALERASLDDLGTVLTLIDTVAKWLGEAKNTRQWERPWPTEEERRNRIGADLGDGKTWIAWDGGRPVATITADSADHNVWPEEFLADDAVYVSRLVVDRGYSGRRIGARLINWAGLRGRQRYGAAWVRVEVWTDNFALHTYYEDQGFTRSGKAAIPDYPASALFQKPTAEIPEAAAGYFHLTYGDL